MAKVKCKVCANEISAFCGIKKVSVSINKPRVCEAYTYSESKLKAKEDIPTVRVGYAEQQASKRRMKAELKRIKEDLKKGPAQGTARDLGLVDQPESPGLIMPGDPRFSMPRDTKHPLTGDLSRFTTTAKEGD